jgi:hypothetical protein
MTGLWQVSGRSTTGFNKRIMVDSFYARHWSIGLDFKIIVVTIPALLLRSDAGFYLDDFLTAAEARRGETVVLIAAAQDVRAIKWRNAARWFMAGLTLSMAGITGCIVGIVNLSYPFQLFGTAALALGCVTATLALLRGEQLEQEADFNGA